MRKELKESLEREIWSDRHKRFRTWSVVFLVFVLVGWLLYGLTSDSAKTVFGTVHSYRAVLHDEGHTIYLRVKVPDKENLVNVRLPKYEPIKKDVKVELRRMDTKMFELSKFAFIKYVD